MKISLVQENPVVCDIEGNASIARDYILKFESSGSDLIVFSELFITGYPPEDLLLREDFLISAQKSVENLSSTIKKSKVLIIGKVVTSKKLESKCKFKLEANTCP